MALNVNVVPDTSIMPESSMSNSLWRLKQCWGVLIERGCVCTRTWEPWFHSDWWWNDSNHLRSVSSFDQLLIDLAKRRFDDSRRSQNITTCCCFSDFYIGGGCSIWNCSLAGMAHSSWLRKARAIGISPSLWPSHTTAVGHKHGGGEAGMGDTVLGNMLVFSVPKLATHVFFNLSV